MIIKEKDVLDERNNFTVVGVGLYLKAKLYVKEKTNIKDKAKAAEISRSIIASVNKTVSS